MTIEVTQEELDVLEDCVWMATMESFYEIGNKTLEEVECE